MNAQETHTTVVVLFGGQSAEHDVSCVTAAHVLRALDTTKYHVVPIGISRGGIWSLAEAPTNRDAERLSPEGDPTSPEIFSRIHGTVVAMPLLHGPLGEDGTVQGLLELLEVPYVGSGVLSSAVCMDKAMAKVVLAAHNIPQVRHEVHHADRVSDTTLKSVAENLGFPVFVKPANMGSSVGVHKVSDLASLRDAVADAATYDEWLVFEEAIVGREIEVSVLGNLAPRASVPGEIEPGDEFYNYDDKYVTNAATLHIPARLTPAQHDRVREMAVQCYKVLRCEGMARVDFFLEEDGRGFMCNEVNTIPGFTPISMYPKLWDASGVSYTELVDELISLALERHTRRRRNTAH